MENWLSLKDLDGEVWKDVVDYEGSYMVSNMGRVKSLKFNKERIFSKQRDGGGYLMVQLTMLGKRKMAKPHQLVAESFLGHVRCGHEKVINHINGDIEDNRLVNLEIVTQRENMSYCHRHDRDKLSSQYVGVRWNERDKAWYAGIKYNGKGFYLGLYKIEIEAHYAYQEALSNLDNPEYFKSIKDSRKPSSPHVGIYFVTKSSRWYAKAKVGIKWEYIGSYKTEEEAYKSQQLYIKEHNL